MRVLFRWVAAAAVALAMVAAAPAEAQQTGALTGVVRDAQGGVLPGVTVNVTGGGLEGAGRTTVTTEQGLYSLTGVPPGSYTVAFELTGFTTQTRDGVVVQVNRTTRLDLELSVGGLQETITVSGETPVVDVSSTVTQTNITKDLYEAIPTGRNPWVMAGLVPGVVTGRLDVGGTEGMQQYNLEAFGSADSQKSFSIDGLKTNWPGGSGGATMQYYGFEMYEEYNMQTASGTAESDVSGVYMNMVTKSGGNRFTSDHNFYFMNDSLQGDNIDDDLRTRLGLGAGGQTGAAGNPIDISYDWSSTLGGPIVRDKLWFFGATRRWRLDQFQIGATNPDGSQAIDDNRIENYMGKVTSQVTPSTRASFMFNRNLKNRFHRRDSPYLFVEDRASVLQDQPAQNYVAQFNQVVGQRGVFDARFGRMWGEFPSRYQDDASGIAVRDVATFQRFNAAEIQSINPNHRYQGNATYSYFVPSLLGGTHDFKAGVQLSWERMAYDRIRNGDILLEMRNGVGFQGQIANTPIVSDHKMETWGAFVQDRWVLGRATINVGVRFDGASGYLPEQSSPAGTYVGERSFARTDVYDYSLNVAPRIGISYDVFGNGQTAIKAYYGRFYNQFGSELVENANPNALSTLNVVWTDRNNNRALDAGELGPLPTFVRGLFPTVDQDADRPYSDEFNLGVEHQLVQNLAVGVSYHRRQHRDGLGIVDRARPTSAYTPETRTYTDSDGQVKSIEIYKLGSAFGSQRDRVITNVDVLKSDYDGVQFDIQKKMSNRWQMLAGLSLQRHKGFDHSGTFTNPGAATDFNNPNYILNRTDGSVFTELPWTFNLSGSYMFPYDVTVAAKYTARDGDPLNRTQVFTFTNPTLSQSSETIRVAQRGEDRTETVNKFVDVRVSKRQRLGMASVELSLDMFNVLNANHVLLQTENLGSSWGRPTRILTPRILRLGATVRF
ncbi:MAG: carboxypeptidase regulatory-like domain-containing protein [Vicinamibacterales bacterium]